MALIPLQQADPMRYKAWIESTQQPNAQLQETTAAAGAAGASAGLSSQETANARLQQQNIQHQLAQQQLLKDTQAFFDKKKNKSGYIDPQTFNQAKQAATALGIDSNSFDSTFGKAGYVDPSKIINYNTAEGQANQAAYAQVKRQIQDRIDQYNQITPDQKGFFSKAQLDQVPLFGPLLAPHAYAYDNSKESFAAQLKGIAGGGQGTGLRINEAELEKWAKLLPSASDTQTVAQDKLKQINGAIKATFNTPTGLDPQYVGASNRPSLSSFMK